MSKKAYKTYTRAFKPEAIRSAEASDRPESIRAQRHRGRTQQIRYFYPVSRETCGCPRIRED